MYFMAKLGIIIPGIRYPTNPAPIAILIILEDLFQAFARIPAMSLSIPIIIRATNAKSTIAYFPKEDDSAITRMDNMIHVRPTAT